VLIVLASPDVVKQVALAADSMGLVDSGWAWISDSVVGKIDFKGDTPEVCADSAHFESFPRQLARNTRAASRTRTGVLPSIDASQATATRRAFHGWLYIAPLDPDTPTVRKFKSDVRKLTESEFGIALAPSEEIDAAAAKLYDGIILWAKALSRVFANNGAPPARLGVGCEACGSGATHFEASVSESTECQCDQLASCSSATIR
jgi:hypothetical protein